MSEVTALRHDRARTGSGAFVSPAHRRRYWITALSLLAAGLVFCAGILTWDNPLPFGTPGFWRIAESRATSVVVILIVAVSQAMATVAFQTAANNRIITPSIMGFESLYVLIQTSAVYFLGAVGVSAVQGLPQYALQVSLMIVFALGLYGWLLSGKYANVQVMLLIGIVLGGGLGAVSTFMQRLLSPSEFDVLSARLFGSVANADPGYFPLAVPLCVVATVALYVHSRTLNVMAMGRDVVTNLGMDHRRELLLTLFWVSILMAVSTSLIGPMTFLGFLVAILAYQFADTHDHRYVFPMAALIGFAVLSGAYFVLKNVFYAEGAVSIIIELVGGSVFLFVILRRGRL
ncbi:iron chelate uptake ABC transporter family permease subunit [Kocuria marina]|uniref:iron chelate uptake ABC transporter family permease subunit n=1 Tax=Kocuria marina TaxID=223184 RepID=UPI0011A34024|nr:iron chelate uptake ABC transporter family permease subunit [Kocuria indica]